MENIKSGHQKQTSKDDTKGGIMRGHQRGHQKQAPGSSEMAALKGQWCKRHPWMVLTDDNIWRQQRSTVLIKAYDDTKRRQ